jgi:hypothetical protein
MINAENSEISARDRRLAHLKLFQKGVSGNPGGKPKGIPGKVNRQGRGYIKKG